MSDEKIVQSSLDQNPSQVVPDSQDYINNRRLIVEQILATFIDILPSNYISEVVGPHYTVQFQAIAEQLADLQITLQEELKDSFFDFTRSEFLYQFIGNLVFPDVDETGFPEFDGDLTYRDFFINMVELILDGSTLSTIKKGLALLSDADFEVIEKAIAARGVPGAVWGFDEQFEFEINVSYDDCTDFPPNPFLLQSNAFIVLRALKPAHTIYTYRHLFKDAFDEIFEDEVSMSLDTHHYDDIRKYCDGAKELTGGLRELFGSDGSSVAATDIFEDLTQTFIASCVRPGEVLFLPEQGLMFEIVQAVSETELQVIPSFDSSYTDLNWVILSSIGGDTLEDRFLFSDPSRDFSGISIGSRLEILNRVEGSSGSIQEDSSILTDLTRNFVSLEVSAGDTLVISAGLNRGSYLVTEVLGENQIDLNEILAEDESDVSYYVKSPNTDSYTVKEILTLPVLDDSVERSYETSPTGLSGNLIVENGVIVDKSTIPVDFSTGVSGEIITINDGPNQGNYRLGIIPGLGGGPIGSTSNPSTEVIPAPSLIRIDRRMPEVDTDQPYAITVDRLGVLKPREVCREDVSAFFTT
jgi:hypothetical protein